MSKKILALALTLVLAMSLLSACGGPSTSSQTSQPSTETNQEDAGEATEPVDGENDEALDASDDMLRIGILQFVEHDALDRARQGFIDGLADLGYVEGENIAIDFQNAQNEQANCVTIADKFVNARYDLVLAIATPAAQAMANATDSIPILVTAVTDPADAKLVDSNELPGRNVSGTSDLTPCAEQIDLMLELVPDVKTIGMLYCSNESNSIFQVNLAKEAAAAKGIETVDFTVSATNELQQVVESMMSKVDAIYSPTDNMIAASMATVSTLANENGIPTIVGESNMVVNGGLATYGINYYDLGLVTARQAARIFEGEDPANMPIEYSENFDLFFNEETAEKLGIEIPADMQ